MESSDPFDDVLAPLPFMPPAAAAAAPPAAPAAQAAPAAPAVLAAPAAPVAPVVPAAQAPPPAQQQQPHPYATMVADRKLEDLIYFTHIRPLAQQPVVNDPNCCFYVILRHSGHAQDALDDESPAMMFDIASMYFFTPPSPM